MLWGKNGRGAPGEKSGPAGEIQGHEPRSGANLAVSGEGRATKKTAAQRPGKKVCAKRDEKKRPAAAWEKIDALAREEGQTVVCLGRGVRRVPI